MTLFWFIFATAQIDLRTYLLPDVLTQPLLWLGLLYHSVYDREMLPDALYGAVAGYLTLWLVWWGCKILAGKEGIGTGDAKLLAAMGARCGWPALPPILLAASLLGIVWWLILRLTRRTSIPLIAFGPWLGLAGWLIFSAQSSGVIGIERSGRPAALQSLRLRFANLCLKIVLESHLLEQIQFRFQPVNVTFFISKDFDHHIPANVVMDAVGIGNGFT